MDDSELRTTIREEMRGPRSLSGYRSIWQALRLRHHIHVPRMAVEKIIKETDPAGAHAAQALVVMSCYFLKKISMRMFSS